MTAMIHYTKGLRADVTEKDVLAEANELQVNDCISLLVDNRAFGFGLIRLADDKWGLQTVIKSMGHVHCEVCREKMLEVLGAYLAGSDVELLCEWKPELIF